MKLFVYGTLMSYSWTMENLLGNLYKNMKFVTLDHLSGSVLYTNGGYPCLKVTANPEDRVGGEVWEITDKQEDILAILDRYEGVDFGLYQRSDLEVTEKDTLVSAYIYGGSVEGLMKIDNGDWLDWIADNRGKQHARKRAGVGTAGAVGST